MTAQTCPPHREVSTFIPDIISICLKYVCHDPNYNYDDDDDMDTDNLVGFDDDA